MKMLVLSGGSGSRLWPVSRETFPKQFMMLNNGFSLLQNTFKRALELPSVNEIITVTNREYFFLVEDEYKKLNRKLEHTYLLEPFGRNTAAPIALVALYIYSQRVDEDLLVLPSDHVIQDIDKFNCAVEDALPSVSAGRIVAFGIKPNAPRTGYGYIQANGKKQNGAFQVKQFVEKPSLECAKAFLAEGNYYWNSGIFLFKASTIIEAFKEYAPKLWQEVEALWQKMQPEIFFGRNVYYIPENSFEHVTNISIDYAIMEKVPQAWVIPMECGWNDVGSWNEFMEIHNQDSNGNRINADALLIDTENTFIQADKIVATIGVKDLIIVDTKDALLIADKHRTQDVKKIVHTLKEKNHESYKTHHCVKRPWGEYVVLEEHKNHKIKRIVVNPGASLSLQYHHHRSEHWVVVAGTAKIVNGEKEIILTTSQSAFISKGVQHRLSNESNIEPLVIVEVQVGDYLGEDDITRLEDKYGRKV